MHCYTICPSLWQTSAELCCGSGYTHSQKGTYNTSFVPAAPFQLTLQDPVSYVESTAWNSTSVSKRSDKNIPVRMLRSESYSLLRVPTCHTVIYGERSFRASAPRLRNELPNHLKLAASIDIFCKVLKTHLFKLAYL